MGYLSRHAVTFTTASDGSATVYSDRVNGHVHAIRYAYVDADTGADITITGETSTIPVLTITNAGTASTVHHPRAATVDVSNAASLYAVGGEPVETLIPVADERIKVVVAAGGNAKTGTLHFYVG